jgi:hypothetical protein
MFDVVEVSLELLVFVLFRSLENEFYFDFIEENVALFLLLGLNTEICVLNRNMLLRNCVCVLFRDECVLVMYTLYLINGLCELHFNSLISIRFFWNNFFSERDFFGLQNVTFCYKLLHLEKQLCKNCANVCILHAIKKYSN